MTREQMIATLRALDARLDHRVTVGRVVLDEKGQVVGHIPRGSFRLEEAADDRRTHNPRERITHD